MKLKLKKKMKRQCIWENMTLHDRNKNLKIILKYKFKYNFLIIILFLVETIKFNKR